MRTNIWRDKLDKMNILLDSVPFQIRFQEDMYRRFDLVGQIEYHENLISLAPDIHERDMLQTIIHEIIEFINRNQEMGLNHHIITSLEIGIMRTIMQNPHLFKIFVEEAERNVFENVGKWEDEEEEKDITTA